jgi:iron complex outermembrane receptor protein
MNMRIRRTGSRGLLASGVASSALLIAPSAFAGTGPDEATAPDGVVNLSEVIVTATKREEKLHDVADSVTALLGEDLLKRQDLTVADLATQVPGLAVEHLGDSNRLIIRGQNTGGAGATAAVVVDDVPFSFSSATANSSLLTADIDTYDLNRVEVLRGPQGTLYGAGAEGGLLKYVTNAPKLDTFEAGLESGSENVAHGNTVGDGKGYINIPVGDELAVRGSAYYEGLPGYIDNPTMGVANQNQGYKYGGRISALFTPSSDLTIRASAFAQDMKMSGDGEVDLIGAAATPKAPPANQTAPVDGLSFASGFPDILKSSLFYSYLNIGYDLHWASLTSITSYGVQKYRAIQDTSGTEIAPGVTYGEYLSALVYGQPIYGKIDENDELHKYNQELRLSSEPGATLAGHAFEWQGGVFLSRETTDHSEDYGALSQAEPQTVLSPALGSLAAPAVYKEASIFGEVTYHFSPALDLSVGGRGTDIDQHSQLSYTAGLLFAPTNLVLPALKSSQTAATYSTALRWHIDENNLLYERIASGFRPGGPELNIPAAPAGYPSSYKSDSTVNYEVGYRTTLFNRTLSIDVAAYYIDWTRIQIVSQFTAQTTGSVFTVTGNAGAATTEGLEWNVDWAPLARLNIQLVGSLTRATLRSDAPTLGASRGDFLPYVPNISNSINIDYGWNAFRDYHAYVGGTWSYIGREYTDFSSSPLLVSHFELPGYGTSSLRAGLEKGQYTAEIFVKNLGDVRALTAYQNEGAPGGYGQGAIIQPRTIGLRLAYQY